MNFSKKLSDDLHTFYLVNLSHTLLLYLKNSGRWYILEKQFCQFCKLVSDWMSTSDFFRLQDFCSNILYSDNQREIIFGLQFVLLRQLDFRLCRKLFELIIIFNYAKAHSWNRVGVNILLFLKPKDIMTRWPIYGLKKHNTLRSHMERQELFD
jgi:hypothetical protein